MDVAIIKYNAGNIYSVVNAIRRLGIEPHVTDDAGEIRRSDCVLFPGQGEAAGTMAYLREHHLDALIRDLRQPMLGICIGMQLMCRHSEEGATDCLNIFDVEVKKFVARHHNDKIPHMGWDTLSSLKTPLFKDVQENAFVYFIHSFYVEANPWAIATNDYILPYCAALHRDNYYAVQFHPEKSGSVGEQILRNFLSISYNQKQK